MGRDLPGPRRDHDAYRAHAEGAHNDVLKDDKAQQHWHVMDVVGYLPDPTKVVQPWRDLGRKTSDDQARDRLEERLAEILQS